jgi:hypothetical protein
MSDGGHALPKLPPSSTILLCILLWTGRVACYCVCARLLPTPLPFPSPSPVDYPVRTRSRRPQVGASRLPAFDTCLPPAYRAPFKHQPSLCLSLTAPRARAAVLISTASEFAPIACCRVCACVLPSAHHCVILQHRRPVLRRPLLCCTTSARRDHPSHAPLPALAHRGRTHDTMQK